MPREERQTLEEMHHPEEIRRRLREPARSSSLPDAILGGIDGCVTTFAVVSGAFGGGLGYRRPGAGPRQPAGGWLQHGHQQL